jgi:hypothetical protein
MYTHTHTHTHTHTQADAAIAPVWQNQGAQEAVKRCTDFSVAQGDYVWKTWMNFYGYMFAKYRCVVCTCMHACVCVLLDV